jgi:hypothetical protein
MRRLALLCSAALLAPGIALAQQQFCAIDGQPPAASPPATATVQAVPVNNNDRNVYPVIRADEIARSPALTRIASKGATPSCCMVRPPGYIDPGSHLGSCDAEALSGCSPA